MRLVFLIILFFMSASVQAHDWYTPQKDPVTGIGCCGGHDCAPVPLDADWVRPAKGGLRVVMTLEQSQQINPYSLGPIDAFVAWDRIQSPPSSAKGVPAIYHVCISAYERKKNGGVYCLFMVPSI